MAEGSPRRRVARRAPLPVSSSPARQGMFDPGDLLRAFASRADPPRLPLVAAARTGGATAAARADGGACFERFAPLGDGAQVVVATGHEADEEALAAALRGKPASVQLVASSRRLPHVLAALGKAGVPAEALALVRAPAGLDI